MTQDAAFLAAIRAAPNDTASRLVYADWLEERGDLRSELVRIEEEMRQLPVFCDQYWQLKPRRNELHARVPEEWLGAMRYGTDCQPLFAHGVPDGWKERWRLIREFTDRWHRLPLGDIGGRPDVIRETEARLRRELPPSLREWVAFAHDVRRRSDFHAVLRDVYQMEELDGHSAVSLLLQGEGDYHWAVRHTDFSLPDPPIHGFHWDFDNDDDNTFVPDERNPIADTLNAFVFEYVMSYTHAEGGGLSTDVDEPANLIRDLTATFPVQTRFGRMAIFEAENILVRLYPSRWTSGNRIVVEVAKPLEREAIPAFLWDYTRNGGAFRGLFTPDSGREEENEIPF